MFKNKKNENSNQLIHNYSSSFLKFKKIKPKLFSLNRFLEYKRNNSINSLSSNYGKNNNIFKKFESFSFNIKNKTLKKKHKIIFLNGNDFKRILVNREAHNPKFKTNKNSRKYILLKFKFIFL